MQAFIDNDIEVTALAQSHVNRAAKDILHALLGNQ